jgi:hypothetical protein
MMVVFAPIRYASRQPMAMETAAAILTKLAIEQNSDLKSRLNTAREQAKVVALIMPLFRQILSELEMNRQAHDKFPSAIPRPSPAQSATAAQADLGHTKDLHAEHHHEEGDDIGGEG